MTRKFHGALVLAVILTLGLVSAGPVVAAPSLTSAVQAAPYALRFTFDNGETLAAGSRVIDCSNLIQKGLWADNSQWKLQLDGAKAWPVCVFAGSRSGAVYGMSLISNSGIADGRWHRLSCERTATSVRLVVDGKVTAKASIRAVRLKDSGPVTIGGRAPPGAATTSSSARWTASS